VCMHMLSKYWYACTYTNTHAVRWNPVGTACVPRVQPRVHAYTRELAARLCLCPCQCPRCCTPAPAALPFSVPPPNVALNSERGGVEDEGRGEKPLERRCGGWAGGGERRCRLAGGRGRRDGAADLPGSLALKLTC